MNAPIHVQLLRVPDCPLAERVRAMLDDCLPRVPVPVSVEELEGTYPSPSLLVNGVDVTTGLPPRNETCCRFDLPTPIQILTALLAPPQA